MGYLTSAGEFSVNHTLSPYLLGRNTHNYHTFMVNLAYGARFCNRNMVVLSITTQDAGSSQMEPHKSPSPMGDLRWYGKNVTWLLSVRVIITSTLLYYQLVYYSGLKI